MLAELLGAFLHPLSYLPPSKLSFSTRLFYRLTRLVIIDTGYDPQGGMAQCLIRCDKCPEQFSSYEELFNHCRQYEPSQELLTSIQHHQVRLTMPLSG